jgi:hypothetical protein
MVSEPTTFGLCDPPGQKTSRTSGPQPGWAKVKVEDEVKAKRENRKKILMTQPLECKNPVACL